MDEHVRPQVLEVRHLAAKIALTIGGERCGFAAKADAHILARRDLQLHGNPSPGASDTLPIEPSIQQVDARATDEFGHRQVGRVMVDRVRGADLQYPPAEHHGHAVRHCHRLGLVVRHVNECCRQRPVQLRDLRAHVHPQLRIQIRQGLIHQECRGLAHHRATNRHALALPTRELAGFARQQGLYVELRGDALHVRSDRVQF